MSVIISIWIFRIVSDLTFTRDSTSNYTTDKLNRLLIVFNHLLDCLEILNINFTLQMIGVISVASITAVIGSFGKFR